MKETGQYSATTLADLTTLAVGGSARELVQTADRDQFLDAIATADQDWQRQEPGTISPLLLVLGGGSNLVPKDEPFPGVVVKDLRKGIEIITDTESSCGGTILRVPAGQTWDELVSFTVENGLMGIEALSGIPGTCGAGPVQNISAYGQELAGSLWQVRVWDRVERKELSFSLSELKMAYRDSILKRSRSCGDWLATTQATGMQIHDESPLVMPSVQRNTAQISMPTGRWVILEVELQLLPATLSRPVAYKQLAEFLGVQLGTRVPMRDLRTAVLALRRSKSMVYDPLDKDSHSAGSFFTNPIITKAEAAKLGPKAPRFPMNQENQSGQSGTEMGQELVKTSAAWLIENSGLPKGFCLPGSDIALSSKHVLAIINRGCGTARQVRELAKHVREKVFNSFGVNLVPEPIIL